MYSRNKQQGFSIIELLIVVAIIAILLLVALPQYQNYTMRAQVSEAISLSAGPKQALAIIAATDGKFSDDVSSISAGKGKYVETGTVTSAETSVVTVTYKFGGQANVDLQKDTEKFIFKGTISGGNVNWTCEASSDSVAVKNAMPSSCSNE